MDGNNIRSVKRTLTLMEILAQKGESGVTELSNAANLNKATVYRQLNTLLSMGYVKKDEKTERYGLTFKLLELANHMLNHINMRDMIRPYLENLAAQSGETVHLVQREGVHCVYIDKVEPTVNSVRMVSRIGMRQPLYCTAVGKAILAELPDAEIHSIWDSIDIRPHTENTIVNWGDFIKEIGTIRSLGYALDNEENEVGVKCVAVAIRDYTGMARHAISVSAPVSRMTDSNLEKILRYLLDTKSNFPVT
jgi:DNA-binding IclR family transcriptional regulator